MTAPIEGLRLPPHSAEAEQGVLGALLLANAAFDRIADLVGEAHFYRADHRATWRAIAHLIGAHKPADVLTVADELKRRGDFDTAGGLAYLHQLASGTPSTANVRHYAEIVRQRSVQRELIAACAAIESEAYGSAPAADLLDRAQAAMLGIRAREPAGEPRAIASVLTRVMENLDARQRGEERRISTGLVDLDRTLHGGLCGGRLYVLAGRPSSGKSALALQIGIHAALNHHPVMVSSLEMTGEENGERAIAAAARIDLDRLITGRELEASDWDRMGAAIGSLNEAPIYIDDTPALTLNQLRARARRMRQRHGVEVLVVDYLQLLRTEGRGENRNLEVSELAEGLKALAKELDVAVVALSQMNRKCEDRPNKRGIVADLRDSGGIDAAADVIVFVYRDEMYDENTPEKGIAELIIRKARQGRIGTVRTVFRGELMRFENAAPASVPAFGPTNIKRSSTRRALRAPEGD